MGWIKNNFLGGAERRAGDIQAQSGRDAQDLIRENVAQARSDAIPLFDAAQQNTQAGFQGAMDVFNQSIPQQQQVFQQGNVGAQQALLAGAPQFQNAILGGQIDYSQMQPQTLDIPQFTPQQLPEYIGINEALNTQPQQDQGYYGTGSWNPSNGGSGGGNFGGGNISAQQGNVLGGNFDFNNYNRWTF